MRRHSIIVSHGHCPDGAAAIVVAKKINPSTEYVMGFHNKIDEQVLKAAENLKSGGLLMISDICCSESTLDKVCEILVEKDAGIGVYEHHVSRDYLAGYQLPEGLEGEIIFDKTRCGSKILYDTHLSRFSEKLDSYQYFITLTNDRDMWINEHAKSAELSSLHAIYGDDKYISRFVKSSSVEFTDKEQVMLDYEKELMMRRMHKLLKEIEIKTDKNGVRYGVMVGEGKASELCNTAIHKFDLEYVFLLDYNGKRGSVRSYKFFNCAKFSEARGGGGHERAAGFPIERQDLIFDL